MSSHYNYQSVNKSRIQHRQRKLWQKSFKKLSSKVKRSSSLINYLSQVLSDLQSPNSPFLSYTISELEPICQQIAIQKMASITQSVPTCPWVCLFCEDLVYEPSTLYCGHTYCQQCIKQEEFSDSSIHCPRCSKDIQGQTQSSISYAREKNFSKNHFLQQLLERSTWLKSKRENILLCHQAQGYYATEKYQQAIEIYSNILENFNDEHLALYGRAKSYFASKEFSAALADIERVILLKPQWAKGYYCRSEILFEMERLTPALLSSLQGLALNPEDSVGRQIMARHLHAVLHVPDDEASAINMQTEPSTLPLATDNIKEIITSGASNAKLLMCRSTDTESSTCLCPLIGSEHLHTRDFECSICVNLLWSPVTTPCGHVFCRECLIRSIDNTQTQCPMCKNPLDEFFPLLIRSHVNKTEVVEQMIETYFPSEFNERHQQFEQENTQGASIPRLLTNNTETLTFEIPIFLCVLTLPHCLCPLHVYEPRYRLMMRRALETESRSFGMCKYDEQTDTFADYGTLLYIRALLYTPDGRSVVDTIGRQRFRVVDRDTRDGYHTAQVQIIRDHPIEPERFDELYQLNRNTYNRVRNWFDQLDRYRQILITQQVEDYPPCDDLIEGSADGPNWAWIVLNLLPIESELQYIALSSRSFSDRLQMINNTMDFLLNQQETTTTAPNTDET